MRTLFLTQTYPRYATDTAGPFIREIALGMVRAGDEVSVLIPHAEGVAESWCDDGISVRSFRYAPETLERIGYSRSLVRDETVRIATALATPLYFAGARRALSNLCRQQPFDVVHAHWIVPNGIVAGMITLPSSGVALRPILAHGVHGSDVFLAEKAFVRPLIKRSLGAARILTGCSPELVDRVSKLGTLSSEGAQIAVIPYGVDPQIFAPGPDGHGWRRRLNIPGSAVVVLGVGRMATKKGFHVLLDAAPRLLEKHPDLHIVLAGAGDRLEEWKGRARPLERIHFPGLVERDILAALYRCADIFCLPAVHDEKGNVDGLPNVILEAMATGLPVVATDVSGIPLAVTDGVTGLLVRENDSSDLSRALGILVSESTTRKQFGESGCRSVRGKLTWDHCAARYRETYLRALETRNS